MPKPYQPGEEHKMSLKECKAILNINGNSYTDEEILKIRDYLYKLAAIEVEHFKMTRSVGKLDVN
jgi:hypothetical protein